jgi:hypothetical protein
LRDCVRRIHPEHFVEIGPGASREITNLLLKLRWTEYANDLELTDIEGANARFKDHEAANRLIVGNDDYILQLRARMQTWWFPVKNCTWTINNGFCSWKMPLAA